MKPSNARRARLLSCAIAFTSLIPPTAALSVAEAGTPAARGSHPATNASCPVLVLSAMPVEAAPVLARAQMDPRPAWVHDGKGFWAGSLEGNRVVVALTGIGIVNATETTEAAFDHFGCFSLVVFSGTSGGDYIGDVMVPSRWTQDGKNFLPTSPAALGVLDEALANPPNLEQTTPVGDPLCECLTAGILTPSAPVTVAHRPQVEIGGAGASNDGFGGRALPCTPAADDVFGCWPCRYPDTAAATQAQNLSATVPPFVDPNFFVDYESASAPPPGTYVSDDMETAAAFAVAQSHGVPVIGFRAASDGGGDPLMLPGFPAEFFFYRELAADNAASVALSFLNAWRASQGT